MSKMNEVIQIGEIEGSVHYYIEDYVYTFLKKQTNNDRKKYFLYGEREENKDETKLYIYGIGEKPKMEQTYFKEYYPLGFLRIKEDKRYWISLSGQENTITGFYVFYAPNQAMQEYLVDFHKEEKQEEKLIENTRKRFPTEMLPMKETAITAGKLKNKKINSQEKKSKIPAGGILIALFLLAVLTSVNGKNKINIFKQVIKETMSNSVKMISGEEIVIEEKKIEEIKDSSVGEPKIEEQSDKQVEEKGKEILEMQETNSKEEKQIQYANIDEHALNNKIEEDGSNQKAIEESMKEENIKGISEESDYEEYIVQNGDTLVAICKKRYNSLLKMKEICELNRIKNADYIAPGQKLYLPR